MIDNEPLAFPIKWVTKEDLQTCRRDLTARIDALDENAMEHLATEIGDVLQEEYWLALEAVLERHFGPVQEEDAGSVIAEQDSSVE